MSNFIPKIIEEFNIKCGDCGSILTKVIITQSNEDRKKLGIEPIKSKFKINNCYKCNGSSFLSKTINGTCYIAPPYDGVNFDIIDNEIDQDGVIITTLRISR